jgi:alkylation response protein AidB-like acyl-CoA dehydrogenase
VDSDLDELRAVVRDFLARACPPPAVRRLMADPAEHDATLWRRLATELGLTGLAIGEEFGGAGCGMTELAVVCEELGRALTPTPYLATAVLAAQALPDTPATATIRTAIANGSLIATVVLEGDIHLTTAQPTTADPVRPSEAHPANPIPTSPAAAEHRLSGTAELVLDGHLADLILLAADGGLYAVDGDAPGLTRTPQVGLDQTRRLTALRLEGVPAVRIGDDSVMARVRDLAVTALAAEQVGGAQRCLEMALEHAKTRVQFGRAIGSFQAIKHKLADMLLRVESARSAASYASRVADGSESLGMWAGVAGSYCAEAYLFVAGENIQIHGGIGVTWEHDAQLHFKRATSAALLFGRPEEHRAHLATSAGLR